MLDFLPPDEMTLAEAGETLAARLPIAERGSCETDRTFYDTFDGLLHAEGMSCVHQDRRLTLVDNATGQELAGRQAAQPTGPIPARELERGSFRDALTEVIGVRALLPLAHVHSRTQVMHVLDGAEKTVVRMMLEEPALVSASSMYTSLRPRLELAVVRGYADELDRLTKCLEGDLGFRPADQPLVDEAVRAAGLVPGGVSSKIAVRLRPGERTDQAAAKVLLALLDVIDANLDGTLADVDSEFLHDFRVAVRRTRSAQRELKRAFPPAQLRSFRSGFRWLQLITGDPRDLDVYVLEFDEYRAMLPEQMRPELDPLLGVLRSRRLIARREMTRELRSDRAASLRSDWRSFLERLPGLGEEDRPDASMPIEHVAGKRISKVYRRMVKLGRAIDGSSPAEDYHELRKKGKELRYLLELFGAQLYPTDVVKPMIRTLKALQDVLGRHQDREVQVATLRSLRDEVSSLPGGPAALMAMGVLVQKLGEDEQAARGEFASHFGAFSSRRQRALVKETFG